MGKEPLKGKPTKKSLEKKEINNERVLSFTPKTKRNTLRMKRDETAVRSEIVWNSFVFKQAHFRTKPTV